MMRDIVNKIKRKWMKMRLRPIRVYCLHHVCAEFDAESMNACDWMEIGMFKHKIQSLRGAGIEFISLTEAYRHICKDWIRYKKYAVLTFDDGYASLKEILPWLEQQRIPVTLFINGKYLDGKSYRENQKEKYLTKEELGELTSQLIEIGNHGWEHIRVTDMTDEEFVQSVQLNPKELSKHPRYIPFWAYTYGSYTQKTDEYLQSESLVPVYVNGNSNYKEKRCVNRELMN